MDSRHLDELFAQRVAPDGTLVRDNFQRWFEGSHAVDGGGKPLVLYHGTNADFDAFDTNAKPHHFSLDRGKVFLYADREAASEYAVKVAENVGGTANVMPVFLALKRPMIVDVEWDPCEEWDLAGGRFEREAPWGTDGFIVRGIDYSDRPATMYVALRAHQIKSAVGNLGTFCPNDPGTTDPIARLAAEADLEVAARRASQARAVAASLRRRAAIPGS